MITGVDYGNDDLVSDVTTARNNDDNKGNGGDDNDFDYYTFDFIKI